MKILVYYNPGPKNDVFEGTRLRKNLKGALELTDIGWVESIFALPDIAHFISPSDEAKAHDSKFDGVKLVVSALYGENDPYDRFLDRDDDGFYSLSPKAERMLEAADLILVPSSAERDLLVQCGLQNPHIGALTPGVNLARFEKSDPIELGVFSRYFRFPPTTKFALTIGDFEDKETVAELSAIAAAEPSLRFFFFGLPTLGDDLLLKKLNREAPKNLRFSPIVEDDVFRSGMMCASSYLAFASARFDALVALEAMASKTQILYVGKPVEGEILLDKKNCLAFLTPDKAAKGFESYCSGKLASTIIEGYRTAKANSLLETGKRLKAYYESVLKDSEETL
jgi:hypothetical protein